MAKILEKSHDLPEGDFVRSFVFYAVASIGGLLDALIFSGIKGDSEVNIFKIKSSQLNSEKVFESIKIIVGHYLTAFLSNKNNKDLLKSIHLTQEDFKNKIFKIFNYNKKDKQIFNELSEFFNEKDCSRYFIRHYKFLTKKTFESEDEDFFHSLYFSQLLSSNYLSFLEEFLSRIQEEED